MSVTAADIAKACGISRGTVDRALNNRPGISRETRQQILKTAEEMGYRPHFLARSLAKGRTMTLGLVVFDLRNRFFAQLADAAEAKARESGYFLYLALTNKDPDREMRCLQDLADRKVDGILVSSVNGNPWYEAFLQALKTPVISIGNRISPCIPFVGIDDYNAMQDATMYAVSKGYRRLVYLSPPLASLGQANLYAQHQRLLGFRSAVTKLQDIECQEICSNTYLEQLSFLAGGLGVRTALLCSSDVFALEVLTHLKSSGLRVPEDLGLMGFDGLDLLKYVEPSLTTVAYPMREIGCAAVQKLVDIIEKKASRESDLLLDYRILKGSSL